MNIPELLIRISVSTPFYPHWLIFRVADRGNASLLKRAKGIVLNVGCGADDKRKEVESNGRVSSYVTLDYPDWDANWKTLQKQASVFGNLREILFRNVVRTPDIWGDGYNLPFQSGKIDTVISQGVLEHVAEPRAFLEEHHRVLKAGGLLLMTTPLLYESHGGDPPGRDDYVRYTEYGLKHLLATAGFIPVSIQPYGNFGTALSQLINSYVIKRFMKRPGVMLVVSLPFLAAGFFVVNSVCWIVDRLASDLCYTAGFFVVARAKKRIAREKIYKDWRHVMMCPKCKKRLTKINYCDNCRQNFFHKGKGLTYVTP